MSNDIFTRLSKFAKVMSILGVCTLGLVPAFGVMGITVGVVFKYKGVEPDADNAKRLKTALILGVVSLVLFVIDIIIATKFVNK